VEHEPLEFCLKIVRNKIDDIMEVTGADRYECYLTGTGNFRKKILPEYKKNRDPNAKPFWYNEITEYLIKQHGAIVCDGIEADDMLGIRQMQDDETVICSKDKDLDCVPGAHYNWSPTRYERGVYNVTEVEALRFFYLQCLTGDATDNIPGLYKSIGKKATKKIKEYLAALETEEEMCAFVKELYEDFDFTPIAQCLHIHWKEGDIWSDPTEG
jgi:5'-3' exonuclease